MPQDSIMINVASKPAAEEDETATVEMARLQDRKESSGSADEPEQAGKNSAEMGAFAKALAVLQVVFIIVYFAAAKYASTASNGLGAGAATTVDVFESFGLNYGLYQDVHVMIFIGFGFLMTFMRRNMFSAVGFTFLIGVLSIQTYIVLSGCLIDPLILHGKVHAVEIDLSWLIRGDFAAGAVLITYGVILGKVTPLQLIVVTLLEVFFFSINEALSLRWGITDLGGSMIIHMFGAFFGLGLSKALTSAGGPKTSSHNASVYHSDVFAMIGTVFLWMYWPSFNSILASGHTEERIVVNTVLSLCASCLTTFCMTTLLNHKKLEMVDIQNATLAGGVAMGTSGALTIGPGAALLIGALAGVVSTLGYKYASPFLEKHGIGDECGVFNLHGMPSILGAVAGIIAVAVQDKYSAEQLAVIYGIDDPDTFNSSDQALMQLLYFGVTMAVSVVTGYLTGLVVVNCKLRVAKDDEQFNDAEYWHVPSEEIPQFFSKDQ